MDEQSTCSDSCGNFYKPGAKVQLRAVAEPNSEFKGWSGACRGLRSCVVSLKKSKSVSAIFNLKPVHSLTYTMAGKGSGTVRFTVSTGSQDCTGTCTKDYMEGTKVTLTAVPAPGSVFSGWSGACRGKRSCSVVMLKAQSVTATFRQSSKPPSSAALQ